MTAADHLDADRLSAPGGEPVLVVEAASWTRPAVPIQAAVIGIDRGGALPEVSIDDFDLLLTAASNPPRPWVCAGHLAVEAAADVLADAVRATPLAATIAAQLLRLTERLSLDDALIAESLAYSALLGGDEFRRWRQSASPSGETPPPDEPVAADRRDDHLTLTLNDPATRNAMTARMRDALYEALANALDDPTQPSVTLQGSGRCFSTGGALFEFGRASDLAEAHAVRVLHSCARALDALRERARVRLHGACIGSGLEVAAAAHRRIAAPGAWFQLPELSMGLVPGAGGTATVPRAIGRHRTFWMLLSGQRLGTRVAHQWGLVHEIEARA
ncbi:enoyl-CoA hydratase/isomerase family protein [Sphingopyxis sp. 113P3]|uniref:enoyl-CoA hydratase/isomerase family protein n=1 Tax=Sphingopyxis sp. (strain 113P3) TaxID=292913 RepID=UPI0006AD165E|nr:enoyl-CoA hydratase/isomerase family protein [Sphingopyxis sp. 113P3]ALC12877.1 enoyl-CoA hydratase [Sphingopyxis sp. 113P3]